jgi:hypothetical protein
VVTSENGLKVSTRTVFGIFWVKSRYPTLTLASLFSSHPPSCRTALCFLSYSLPVRTRFRTLFQQPRNTTLSALKPPTMAPNNFSSLSVFGSTFVGICSKVNAMQAYPPISTATAVSLISSSSVSRPARSHSATLPLQTISPLRRYDFPEVMQVSVGLSSPLSV